jgi:hypothetical protein
VRAGCALLVWWAVGGKGRHCGVDGRVVCAHAATWLMARPRCWCVRFYCEMLRPVSPLLSIWCLRFCLAFLPGIFAWHFCLWLLSNPSAVFRHW